MGPRYGSLDYVSYDAIFFSERVVVNVDNFMELIIARLGAGNDSRPYPTKQVSGQFPTQANSPPFSFDIKHPIGIPNPPIAGDYFARLLDVVREQNAAHGLRQLGANVEGYAPYSGGSFEQQQGPAAIRRTPIRSSPIFIAVEDLINQSVFLEVEQVDPDTFPDAYRQRYIQFLSSTLDQLKTLPPQVPFIGRRREDLPDPEGQRVVYYLQRDPTETRASSQFTYSLAVSVTEAFLSFAETVSALSYMRFRVVAIVDGIAPAFIGFGTFGRLGTPVLGGQNGSSAAVDVA